MKFKLVEEKQTLNLDEALGFNEDKEFKICVICNKEYEGYGNNAEPVAHGQCCDECNMKVVIPARLKGLKEGVSGSMTIEEIADKHKVPVEDIRKQLEIGVTVEKEHTEDEAKAERIALDHLYEMPNYYDELAKMEKSALKESTWGQITKGMGLAASKKLEAINKKDNETDSGIFTYLRDDIAEATEGIIESVFVDIYRLNKAEILGRYVSDEEYREAVKTMYRIIDEYYDKYIVKGEPWVEESLKEDTIKQNGKWVNKGKEGTHGTFRTKKAADAQRKAMFANSGKNRNFGESLNEMKEKASEIKTVLEEEGIWCDVYPGDNKVNVSIDFGDWKHEHMRAKNIIHKLYPDVIINSIVTDEEEDPSDTYSAIHEIYFDDKLEEDFDHVNFRMLSNPEFKELAKKIGLNTIEDLTDYVRRYGKDKDLLSSMREYAKGLEESLKEGRADIYAEMEDEYFKALAEAEEKGYANFIVAPDSDNEAEFDTFEEAKEYAEKTGEDKIHVSAFSKCWGYYCDGEYGEYDEHVLDLDKNIVESLNESTNKNFLKKEVKKWARDDFEVGKILDWDDREQFEKILLDNHPDIKDYKEMPDLIYNLFDLYWEEIDKLRENKNIDEKLIQGKSDATLKKNIATEIEAGKDPKQAYAIAKSVQKKNESFESMPSREHTLYVLHNVIDYERDYSPKDLTNIEEVAIACNQYDSDYSVKDYIGAIEYYDIFDEEGRVITDLDESLEDDFDDEEYIDYESNVIDDDYKSDSFNNYEDEEIIDYEGNVKTDIDEQLDEINSRKAELKKELTELEKQERNKQIDKDQADDYLDRLNDYPSSDPNTIAEIDHKSDMLQENEYVDLFDNTVHDEDIIHDSEDDLSDDRIQELAQMAITEAKKNQKEIGATLTENKPVDTKTLVEEVINTANENEEEVIADYVSPNAVDPNMKEVEVDLNNI